jgi:hypothetical protein
MPRPGERAVVESRDVVRLPDFQAKAVDDFGFGLDRVPYEERATLCVCRVDIDLGDGRCGYGRELTGGTVAFYARSGETAEHVDLLDLVAEAVAFRIWVMDRAFRRRGGWELLDVVPLTDAEQAEVRRYAKQDSGGRISVYYTNPTTGRDGERSATFEDVRHLERAAVWEPEHVEDRLRDHFDGRPNKWVESLRLNPRRPSAGPVPR